MTVLERTEDYISPKGHHLPRWICECSCGKDKIGIVGATLLNGATKSCGCLAKEKANNLVIQNTANLLGQTFERLYVIARVDISNDPQIKKRRWLCKCNCGSNKKIYVSTNQLVKGLTKSCGCLRKELTSTRMKTLNLVGDKFGKLNIIEEVDNSELSKNKYNHYWLCKCDCGNEKDVIKSTTSLRSGYKLHCGCEDVGKNIKHKSIPKQYNTYDLTGEFGIGYTYKGYIFYFDLEDYYLIKGFTWSKHGNGYIFARTKDSPVVNMHRLVIQYKGKDDVDHINHNKYDNRKNNLRIATRSQNNMNQKLSKINSSGKTGVYWDKRKGKWNAKIGYNGKSIDLGFYKNIENAIVARKEAEEYYFGEYSYDNSQKISQNKK